MMEATQKSDLNAAVMIRVISPPNSTTGGSRFIFSVPFSYFLFIFHLPRCTLPDFPIVSFLASLLFLSCYHRTKCNAEEGLRLPTHLEKPLDVMRKVSVTSHSSREAPTRHEEEGLRLPTLFEKALDVKQKVSETSYSSREI